MNNLKIGDWIKTPCKVSEGIGKPIIDDFNYGRIDEVNDYQALCNMIDPYGNHFDKIYQPNSLIKIEGVDQLLKNSTLTEGVLYLRMKSKFSNHEQR